jgi:hypothetical protein
LVVRGKLLEKFPDTLIFVHEAEFVGTPDPMDIKNSPRKMKANGQSIFPAFTAKLGTDVTLVGFDITPNEALGKVEINGEYEYTAANAGYYFAMQERPGQLRFGLDALYTGTQGSNATNWDALAWDYLNNPAVLITNYTADPVTVTDGLEWGKCAADMAAILSQRPVLFLVHSKDMIL